MQHDLLASKRLRCVLVGASLLTGLGQVHAAAQQPDEAQAILLQCGIFYGLLAEQADPDSAETMQAYADSFLGPVENALTEAGLSEQQRNDINAQYAAPIGAALMDGTDPDIELSQCAGIFANLYAVDLTAFTAHPELHQQFTCGTGLMLGAEALEEDGASDPQGAGLTLIQAAYHTLANAGVDDLGQFAITQGYMVNLSQAMSSEGDGDIGFTLDECLDLIEK